MNCWDGVREVMRSVGVLDFGYGCKQRTLKGAKFNARLTGILLEAFERAGRDVLLCEGRWVPWEISGLDKEERSVRIVSVCGPSPYPSAWVPVGVLQEWHAQGSIAALPSS
jgi:hypothetical protein